MYSLGSSRNIGTSKGLVMLDARHELAWLDHSYGEVMNPTIQAYHSKDYLTF